MGSTLAVKIWGSRGLVSSPRNNTAKFGGNTTCFQILYKDHLILIDSGFGISNLGERLQQRIISQHEKLVIHIFYTHFHWDHIQGLPFFHPIYFPTSVLHLYSPLSAEAACENLDPLFDGSYSPFSGITSMPSKVHFHSLSGGITIDGLKISHCLLDHLDPAAPTYAYRLELENELSLVVASDHEGRPSPINDKFVKFAAGTKLLIHDAQWTNEEYPAQLGWGHSSVGQALDNARACGANRTLLGHHHPRRDDDELTRLFTALQMEPQFRGLRFEFAQEGEVYEVSEQEP